MIKNIPKNLQFFKNTKKIEDIRTTSSFKSNNKNNNESPIKLISSKNKLCLSSLFIDDNNNNNKKNNYNNSIIISIISFLSYEDLLQFQNVSKKFYKILSNRKIRKQYILHSNIYDNEHLLFYESNINIKELKNILVKELIDYKISSNIYKNILALSKESKDKNSKYSNVLEEIKRDINRTFYTEKFKKGNGKEMLINILSALAFIRPEIGYCQGMNFIAGALIELIEEEEKIFWIFLSFIDNIDLNLLFLANMPDYSIRVYQLNYYIKQFYPDLFIHFKKNQINPDIFFSKWILTIFANYLPFHKLYKIWDLFIIDKWKAIFRISIILLGLMKDKLIKLDLNDFGLFFKSKESKDTITFKYITEHYGEYKITNKKLKELKEDFFVEKVKEKLDDKIQEWDLDQKEFVTIYKKELNNHENEIKEKIIELKNKIEKINKKYDIKYQKYMKQSNIVKNLKLQLETKIEVKAGYEKVLQRNSGKDFINSSNNINSNNNNKNKINSNNNNNNYNNINIGININLNHDNNKKEINPYNDKMNNQINIFNNNNNIYVNNINIINPHFNFDGQYQINNINNINNINEHNSDNKRNFYHIIKSSSTHRYTNNKKNQKDPIKRHLSFKKIGNFRLFGGNKNELDKIKIQVNNLEKEIDSINKDLIKNYGILDKDKNDYEKIKNKKDKLKHKFDELINNSQKYKNDLLKNLSEKLKLSAKFVTTNKY